MDEVQMFAHVEHGAQEALVRRQVEAYEADPSAGASKGHSSIQIRRDWKAKEKQLQVGSALQHLHRTATRA